MGVGGNENSLVKMRVRSQLIPVLTVTGRGP
jgi:hypothetical protein